MRLLDGRRSGNWCVGDVSGSLEVENELFEQALIMPEPCPFLNRSLPVVPIIRPTNTQGAAMGAVTRSSRVMGLFIGQSPAFFAYMTQLAQEADAARRGV